MPSERVRNRVGNRVGDRFAWVNRVCGFRRGSSLPVIPHPGNGGTLERAQRIAAHASQDDEASRPHHVADIPDLDACSALGRTAEEALVEVERARELWLEAARAAGKPVPHPRYRPAIYQAR